MLSAADLGQLLHAETAQQEHRARTAGAAWLQLVERFDVGERQELRRNFTVDFQIGAAGAGTAELLRKAQNFRAELLNMVAADGKAGGKLVAAIAFQQRRQGLQRRKQIKPAVGAGGRLPLLAVETD